MDFDTYQTRARESDTIPGHIKDTEKVEYCILGATGQIGDITGYLKKGRRDGTDYRDLKKDIGVRLGHMLWYISAACSEMNFTLKSIAEKNLDYNKSRWNMGFDDDNDPTFSVENDFDNGFPPNESLPDTIWARFECFDTSLPKVEVFVRIEGREEEIKFGDRIDDNANSADGYRFHDVFHFGYFAFLDWSPVIRKLVDRKRRSKANVDRIEDGARARDREEATTTFIYNYVVRHGFLPTTSSVDTSLLDAVGLLIGDLEVSAREKRLWEQAIIVSARTQKSLMDNNGGWVVANRASRTLRYSKSGPAGVSSK